MKDSDIHAFARGYVRCFTAPQLSQHSYYALEYHDMSNNNSYQHTRIQEADRGRSSASNNSNDNRTRVEEGRGVGPTTSGAPSTSTNFETYSDFVLYISQRKSPQCDTALIESSRQVESLFRSWLNGQALINSQVKCKHCSKTTCIACFRKEAHKFKESTVEDTKLGWCCSRGRLFIIWIMLCGFDIKFCNDEGRVLRSRLRRKVRRVKERQ